ncbi:MAG: hypothetical protein K2O61_09695, partial [Bacteroidaceae bacterium]|nr:hypothetical protein [Bacteroidaceae bacterium]
RRFSDALLGRDSPRGLSPHLAHPFRVFFPVPVSPPPVSPLSAPQNRCRGHRLVGVPDIGQAESGTPILGL